MQGLVGIGHVDAALDQPGGEVFGRLAVAVQLKPPVGRLAPAVRLATVAPMAIGLPGRDREIVIETKDAKGRNDVLAEIFVLVVAPDQHQVRVERIECGPDRAEVVGHPGAVALRCRVALVVAKLSHQLSRPIGLVLVVGRHAGCGQQAMEARRQTLVGHRQAGIVGAAETENLTHLGAPFGSRHSRGVATVNNTAFGDLMAAGTSGGCPTPVLHPENQGRTSYRLTKMLAPKTI